MLHYTLSYLEGVPASPFGLQQMKSQLMAFRWRVCPRSQATAAGKFTTLFFKNGPVLNPVFIETRHFGSHFFIHFFVAKRSPKKGHNIGITPKAFGERKVTFFPNAKDESVSGEYLHRRTIHSHANRYFPRLISSALGDRVFGSFGAEFSIVQCEKPTDRYCKRQLLRYWKDTKKHVTVIHHCAAQQ